MLSTNNSYESESIALLLAPEYKTPAIDVTILAVGSRARFVWFLTMLCLGVFVSFPAIAQKAPLVLYTFEEGHGSSIRDVSGTGQPLDLTIDNPDRVRWIPGGGLSIEQPTIIQSTVAATKIHKAISASNAMTMEIWMRSHSIEQSGPARIATLSNGTGKRNFTLGQSGTHYDIRLRSTETNSNGLPSTSGSSDTASPELAHVVYTRNKHGVAKLYIDGVRIAKQPVSGVLDNWSKSFLLSIANETSLDRPWLGDIYRFAMYDRALNKSEVLAAFGADTSTGAADDGPIALYMFNEGNGSIVYDKSKVGAPLNLNIADTQSTKWLAGGGLSINTPTMISATESKKITDAVKSSNSITIEAWLQPNHIDQGGPARIVTLSSDTNNRNFTLAQQDSTYDVRLRSTSTNLNGIASLSSNVGTLDTNRTHVVYSRDVKGTARLYINGLLQAEKVVDGDFSNWDSANGFALANELTANRPWIGTLYKVAIYDRAFLATDVENVFALGFDNEASENTTENTATDDQTANQSTANSESPSTETLSHTEYVNGSVSDSSSSSANSSGDAGSLDSSPRTGSASINWSAPVSRSDGAALSISEIAGYTVYFGSADESWSGQVDIQDAYITSAVVSDLPTGSYYFAVTAHDTNGQESALSNTLNKIID